MYPDIALSGNLTLDKAGTIVDIDQPVASLFGYTVEQLVGKPFSSHLTSTCRVNFPEALAAAGNGETGTVYANTTHAKGFVLPLELTLVEKEGDRLTFSVTDLSHRRALESELEQIRDHYALLSETTTDLILQIDSNLMIQYANSAAETVLGVKPERLVNQSFEIVFPKSHYSGYRERIRKYFIIDDIHRSSSGLKNVMEALALKSGGELIPVELSMGNSRGVGENRILTCIIRDITSRKKAKRSG